MYNVGQRSEQQHVFFRNAFSTPPQPVECLTVLYDVKQHSVVSYQHSGGFLYEGEVLLQNGHQKVARAEREGQTFKEH